MSRLPLLRRHPFISRFFTRPPTKHLQHHFESRIHRHSSTSILGNISPLQQQRCNYCRPRFFPSEANSTAIRSYSSDNSLPNSTPSPSTAAASSLYNPNQFSLYFHYPYCNKLCPYCNFNKRLKSRKGNPSDQDLMEAYVSQLRSIHSSPWYSSQNDTVSSHSTSQKQLRSVFFGGGTPSLGDPELYHSIIEEIKTRFQMTKEQDPAGKNSSLPIEITMEMNPTLATPTTLEDMKKAGINRMSIGVQSLRDEDLKFLGREHNAEQAKEILQNAMKIYGRRVSADLMFGLPSHHRDAKHFVEDSLRPLLDMGLKHISLYELTIEKGTPFHKLYFHEKQHEMDSDTLANLYEACIDLCREYGLYQYEVSNFAASPEDESVHNTSYWHGIDYIGLGPGAHSRITDMRNNTRMEVLQFAEPIDWHYENRIGKNTSEETGQSKLNELITWRGNSKIAPLSSQQRLDELIMVALRMPRFGLSLSMLRHHTNDPSASFDDDRYINTSRVKTLVKEGLLEIVEEQGDLFLRVTEDGVKVLNGVVQEVRL